MSASLIVAAALVWLGLLFAVALFGERRAGRSHLPAAWIYALGLGVHCTSWTFYGTITQAQRSGWWLPPTFAGMIALFTFGWPVLARLVRLAKTHNSTTVADFAAARLGKSSGLAAVITGVMLLGTVPYLALQLKAVSTSFDLLAGRGGSVSALGDSALWVTLAMAAFAMLFGTRHAAAGERHPGLLLAVAFESLLKLVAFLAIGLFVVFGLYDGPWQLAAQARQELPPASGGGDGFLTLILLGALATFTLPHQYHVAVTECADPDQVRQARWRFPLFLLAIALPIMPLAWAGSLTLGDALPSDLYVLGLPLASGRPDMALLAFLGGLSAATAMVVVATLALSLMLGNHWITPLLRRRWVSGEGSGDLLGRVLLMRRLGIVVVLGLAWIYSRTLFGSELFRQAIVTSPAVSDTTKPVTVTVQEAPPREIELGVGFNTVEFAQLQADFTRYNFLGGGRRVDLRAAVGNLLAPQLHDRTIFGTAVPEGISDVDDVFLRPTWQLSADFQQPFLKLHRRDDLSFVSHPSEKPRIIGQLTWGTPKAQHRVAIRQPLDALTDMWFAFGIGCTTCGQSDDDFGMRGIIIWARLIRSDCWI